MQEMLRRERNDQLSAGLMMTGEMNDATRPTSIYSSMGVLAPLDMVGVAQMLRKRVSQRIGAEMVEIKQNSTPT
jgi:hypothetical protein